MAATQERYTPFASITIDNSRQRDLEAAVSELVVDDVLDGLSMFRLNLFDEPDRSTLQYKWIDSPLLDPAAGKEISISIGYAESSDQRARPVFTGYIVALSPSFPSSGTPSIIVEGYDHSYKLQKTGLHKTFAKISDYSDIVKNIASMNGIGIGSIDQTGIKPKDSITIDAEQSDYLFIKRLAERFGYDFFVRDKKIHFVDPNRSNPSPIALKLGEDLISFSPRMSAAQVVTGVTVTGYSPERAKEPIKGVAAPKDIRFREQGTMSAADLVASGALGKANISLHSYSVSSDEEAKAVARAIITRANNSFIEGTCECIGNPKIRAGSDVKIEGVSRRFEGIYRVRRCRHSLGKSGYTMSLDLMRGGA